MKNNIIWGFLLIFFVGYTSCFAAPQPAADISCDGKQIVGRIENVILADKNIPIEAKLDTGATMASLSAIDVSQFTADNKTWVKFTLYIPATQQKIIITKPLIRYTKILNRAEENESNAGDGMNQYSIRPVISMPVIIGHQQANILVNLADRTHFHYPMLLGDDALKAFKVLIDVSQEHVTRPQM